MKRLLLFIKQNVLLFILVCFTATVIMMYALSGSGESHCRFVYDFQVCDFGPDGQDEESQTPVETPIENSKNTIDVSKYTTVMPVSVGTRWVYEGKRLFYDREAKMNREVVARKVVEITEIAETEKGLKVDTKEIYTNDPDFTERERSYFASESGFDFGTGKIANFPLIEGQEVRSIISGTDNLYPIKVSKVHPTGSFGNNTPCYDIDDSTLGSTSFATFCEGVGYVRDYYEHHGTPDESDYLLARTVDPQKQICPDDFRTSEEQIQAINNWTNKFYEEHPDTTVTDLSDARYEFLQRNRCVEAIQRWEDAKNGKADSETIEMIDGVVGEAVP